MLKPKLTVQEYLELQNPDIVDDKTVGGFGKIYLGYCKNASPEFSDNAWNIMEIDIKANGVITYLWAGGVNLYSLVWDDRTTYTYKTLR